MYIPCIIETYIVPLIPLCAAILVYFLGRSTYFRQKEYELITKRYLEEGIDAISNNVDRSLALFRHNWWISTVILKNFRDLGKDIRPDLYKQPFIEPDPSLFEVWRDYRLKDILDDDIFNRVHQSLDAFIRSSYSFFMDDLCSMVRVTIEGGKELEVISSRETIVDEFLKKVIQLEKESHRFYVLLGELQVLSSLLQSERFSFSKIKTLRNRTEVKKIITTLKQHFAGTLSTTQGQPGA